MKRRNVLAAILAIVTALLFSPARHVAAAPALRAACAQRRARGAAETPRGAARATPAPTARARTGGARSCAGVYDFDHQIVLSGRTHDGSPGVQILTPLHPDSGGPAVLVNRGWVYSPDAATVDLGKWDEPPHATVSGYVEDFVQGGRGIARLPSHPNAWTASRCEGAERRVPVSDRAVLPRGARHARRIAPHATDRDRPRPCASSCP